MKDNSGTGKLKKKLWKIFSLYIRQRDKGTCFTCGVKHPIKEMQAGHYIHNRCDFDEMNVNCQCIRCNHFKHGEGAIYAERLIKKYGPAKVDALRRRSKQIEKYTIEELEELIEKYRKLIK